MYITRSVLRAAGPEMHVITEIMDSKGELLQYIVVTLNGE